MSVLDIVLLCCFIPAVITGISKGFVEQAIALLSIFLSAYLAFHFSSAVSVWLSQYISVDEKVMNIIAFAVIIVLTVLVLGLLGKLLSKVFKVATLGWLDKLLGIVFAFGTTVLILGLLIMVFEGINEKFFLVDPEQLEGSPVYMWIKQFSLKVFPYFQEWFASADISSVANV